MIKLSVIIAAYGNADLLDKCLESIYRFNDIGDALEVIVSDNSPDDSVERTVKNKYCEVKYVKNPNNGFGYANNRGYQISAHKNDGGYLLFLNPDTVLIESVFGFAVEKFENDKNLAMFGVGLVDKAGNKKFSYGAYDIHSFFTSFKNRMCIKRGKYVDGKMFTSGADMFIRGDVFADIGMFDENIFMYYEESDLMRRIKSDSTRRTAFFGEKKIVHLEGGCTGPVTPESALRQVEREYASEKYYAGKYNLDFKKIVRYRLKTAKLKKFIYKLTGKTVAAMSAGIAVEFLNRELHKLYNCKTRRDA